MNTTTVLAGVAPRACGGTINVSLMVCEASLLYTELWCGAVRPCLTPPPHVLSHADTFPPSLKTLYTQSRAGLEKSVTDKGDGPRKIEQTEKTMKILSDNKTNEVLVTQKRNSRQP